MHDLSRKIERRCIAHYLTLNGHAAIGMEAPGRSAEGMRPSQQVWTRSGRKSKSGLRCIEPGEEAVELARTPKDTFVVRGVVSTAERKEQLQAALGTLRISSPRVEIQTAEEAWYLLAPQSTTMAAPPPSQAPIIGGPLLGCSSQTFCKGVPQQSRTCSM
jgi:hypothetical protein